MVDLQEFKPAGFSLTTAFTRRYDTEDSSDKHGVLIKLETRRMKSKVRTVTRRKINYLFGIVSSRLFLERPRWQHYMEIT